MRKDFDSWNRIKKKLDSEERRAGLYFHEGDIWWAHLGANIGYEMDGKRADYSRPVIVLKKYNQYSFLALPLTTNSKANRWRIPIGPVSGVEAFAVLSQLRNLDTSRLMEKADHLPQDVLAQIKKMVSRSNLD